MSYRTTKKDRDDFRKDWLAEPQRCGHQWAAGNARCTACGRKYGKAAGALCPKRKRPNRWKLHERRAWMRATCPTTIPDTTDPKWMLAQLADIASEIKYSRLDWANDLRLWKFHRLARRHRALLRAWWATPAAKLPKFEEFKTRENDHGFKRDRTKLYKRALAAQSPILTEGNCTYTFYPDARIVLNGTDMPLFREEASAA